MENTTGNPRTRSPETFELLTKIGEGGMGQVFKAKDLETGEVVAIKFLLPGADVDMMERLRNEAREHATLSHPNVVRLIDYFSFEEHEYMVMEFLGGGNLRERLGQPMDVAEALTTFAQICAGLECIHRQGLVHRDLKPENILFSEDGQAKIADLGIVRRLDVDRGLTVAGALLGSTRYMAPEQVLRREVFPAADLYALGIALFEALTGDPPFNGNSDFELLTAHLRQAPPPLRSRREGVPASLETLVAELLEKSADNRPRSAGQVQESLLSIKAELQAQPGEVAEAAPSAESLGSNSEMHNVILGMSQPFRNSMNGVLGMAQLLQGATLTPQHRQYLRALEESAESLRVSFSDLLDYARIRADKLRLDPVPTNLRGLVQNVLDGAKGLALYQSASLFSHVDVSVPDMVLVDPLRLRQVLSNLTAQSLRQARKGNVSLLVQREHDDMGTVALQFSITDNVSTLTAQEARELFLPNTEGRGGYGLNLFLTNHLVESMGGRCWAQSAAGRGTTYTVQLQLQVSGDLPPAAEEEPLTALSILIADDQMINQALTKALLKVHGHEVQAVFNGLEVLQALEKGTRYDVILMDMMMPEMDGLTCTQRIREMEKERGGHMPIIALTALDEDAWQELRGKGLDNYIPKPIEGTSMLRIITETIRKHRKSLTPARIAMDLDALKLRVGGSQRHVDMLVEIFLESHVTQLEEMEQAFRQGDLLKVGRTAGYLQTSLQGLCADPAARAAGTLQQLAAEQRNEAAVHARRELLAEIEHLLAAIRAKMPHLLPTPVTP